MTPIMLKNWRPVPCDGPGARLCGIVYGHPGHSDGVEIVTSPVAQVLGPWLVADGSGGQILIYDQSRQMVLPGSATTTTTGMANGNTVYNQNGNFGTANTNVYSTAQSQTIYSPPTVIPINRKRMFWVNGEGTIYRWSWQGL